MYWEFPVQRCVLTPSNEKHRPKEITSTIHGHVYTQYLHSFYFISTGKQQSLDIWTALHLRSNVGQDLAQASSAWWVWCGICTVIWEYCFTTVNQDVWSWILFYHRTSIFTTVKQDVQWETRLTSENGSFCEHDFFVVNPDLGLKIAFSADKLVFFLWNRMKRT